MGVKSLVKQVLIGKQNKAYAKKLESKAVTYDRWIREKEQADVVQAISGRTTGVKAGNVKLVNEGTAKELTTDGKSDFEDVSGSKVELVYFISDNGRPAEIMEAVCQRYFVEHPECIIAYGDEDVWQEEGTERKKPWFKPDWSPDLLDSYFYFGSVVVLRREWYERAVKDLGEVFPKKSSGIAKETLFALTKEVYEWLRKCVRLAGGYTRGGAVSSVVGHIPQILFHCNSEAAILSYCQCDEICCERQEHSEENTEFQVYGVTDIEENGDTLNKLSIIIPSKDNPEILEKCIEGIVSVVGTEGTNARTTILNSFEIIVVDNGSCEKNKGYIEDMLRQYNTVDCTTIYLYQPMEFHFSGMCNMGAEAATGNLLLFLNDDVELCQKGCLHRMAALAKRPYTGAVGLKLYYPQSVRIQHAGITNLPMGPVHKLQFLEDNTSYYFNSNRGLRNVLAVTAACLMVETEKFLQTGGFGAELRVAFNDVDLCFQLYELGYANVCVNNSFAYHHESLSRGDDEAADKLARLLQERDTLYQRHPALEDVDPYFAKGLSGQGLDTRIRPVYETAGNVTQKVTEKIKQKDLSGYKQDNCVLLRVESVVAGKLQGYGVVLGDNNACYERELLFLLNRKNRQWESAYAVILDGQYRPDLVENMPDQCNVGLCGFDVQLPPTLFSGRVMVQDVAATEYLPAGTYQIGMAVRNRVTGLRLMNVSNRFVTIECKG